MSMFGARMSSEVSGSGPVKRKGSSKPKLEPESGGRKFPSKGEVSISGDSGTPNILSFQYGEGSVCGRFLDGSHEVGDRRVINFPPVGLEPDPIIVR